MISSVTSRTKTETTRDSACLDAPAPAGGKESEESFQREGEIMMQRMGSRLRLLGFAALALLVSGCGTIKYMKEMPAGTAVKAPAPGKAMVVFMRSSFLGQAIGSSVFEIRNDNPELVGLVANKTMVAHEVDAGRRLFMVVSESADYMSADLAPGRTYYAFVTPRMGAFRARFSLAPVKKGGDFSREAESCLRECRLVANTPESEQWARENMDSIRSKHAENYSRWNQKPEKEKPHLASADAV